MSKTFYSTSDTEAKKLWDEKLFRDTVKESYFNRFMGTSPDSLVQVKTDLEKSQGDKINFGIRMRLTGDAIVNGVLEGNEQKIQTYMDSVTINQYRLGVRDAGKMARQRSFFQISDESKVALKDQGVELIDQLCFDAITASPTKIIYGGVASSTSDIQDSDLITPDVISKLRAGSVAGWATSSTNGERDYTPIRPVKVEGKNYYLLLVHPYSLYDLKNNPTFAQARREAEIRGKDNPIFSGSTAVWDGVIIHEHENVPLIFTGGAGSNVAYAKNIFMGAQALCWAWGQRPEVVMEEFDYKNEIGYGWDMLAGVTKPTFNSKDYGSVALYTAITKVAG